MVKKLYRRIVNFIAEKTMLAVIALIVFLVWLFVKEQRIIFSVLISLFSLSQLPLLYENESEGKIINVTYEGKATEALIKLFSSILILATAVSTIIEKKLFPEQDISLENLGCYMVLAIVSILVSLIIILLIHNRIYKSAKEKAWLS